MKFCLPSFQQTDLLAEIEHRDLVQRGIKGIILDLDNSIVSEDDRYLSPDAEAWITHAHALGFQLFLLSNGRRLQRFEYWSSRLNVPGISRAKKPFPKNFRRAIASMRLAVWQVVVVGDSYHTDVLGAWLVGCHCVQVASLPHPPRSWERLAGRWLHRPYPQHRALWNLESLPVKRT